MIVVDTSAIFAILNNEPTAAACSKSIAANAPLLISAGTLAEAWVVAARRGWTAKFAESMDRLDFVVIPVSAETSAAVGQAYAQWGKGLHPAGLNFGDCFAYALAKERNCPLLFVGEDFAKTDIVSALA